LKVARGVGTLTGDAVQVVEQSADGAALMERWRGAAKVIVVDAFEAGKKPGQVFRFDVSKGRLPANLFHTSTHAFGVAEAVELARTLQQLPPHVIIYGIQGGDFTAGQGLTPAVALAAEQVISQIEVEIRRIQNGAG
jgi:hydrogenase maturation protease